MVVAVAEAVGDAAVELDEPVDGFGAAVGGVGGVEVGKELAAPLLEGASDAGDLGDRARCEGGHDLLGQAPACGRVGLVVDPLRPGKPVRRTPRSACATRSAPAGRAEGASTSRIVRRPWLAAITPQARRPCSARGDSTVTTSRRSSAWTLITCKPGSPTRRLQRS